MPTALVLTLRPTAAATVAPFLGRAAHAAFFTALTAHDAALAQRLHDHADRKPFAASDLLGAAGGRGGRAVQPERRYALRWTSLSPELDLVLRAWADAPPASMVLDETTFAVEGATIRPELEALAGVADWPDLIALEQIGRAAPPSRFAVEFLAPTTFRSSGRNVPLPLPELVIGSLLDRWNSSAPLALPWEVRRFAADCLVLSHYELRTVRVAAFGGMETAFVGRCTFGVTNRDRYYLHCCAALLRLAFFTGIGAKASMGFGLVRVDEPSYRPQFAVDSGTWGAAELREGAAADSTVRERKEL
jgi:CRISPR-associated endoribonuclease Cas6